MSDVESPLEKAIPPEELFDGLTFKKFRLRDFASVEKRIREDFLATAIAGAANAPPEMQDRILNLAIGHLKDGSLRYGRRGFDEQAQSITMLPFLLWIALRITDPEMEFPEVDKLLTEDSEPKLYWKVLEQMGYKPRENQPDPKAKKGKLASSPGSTSSKASSEKDTGSTTLPI